MATKKVNKKVVPKPTSDSSNRRSTFLINPKFQLSFFGYFALLSVLLCVFLYFSIHMFFRRFNYAAESLNLSKDHLIFVYLNQQETYLRMIFLSASLVGLVTVFVGALYLSHRVAGPMFRLRTALEQMIKKGDLDTIQFRNDDYFTEVATTFNRLVNKLKDKK